MKVIKGIANIRKFARAVLALGVFDGVHKAHRRILKSARSKARLVRGISIALTFYPHPHAKKSIYSLKHRLRLIASTGIDACIVINFSPAFSRLSAESFVKNILVKKIGARFIYVGKNYKFGAGGRGDFRALIRLGRIYNFKVKVFKVLKSKGRAVSSTLLRKLISEGKLIQAKKLLSGYVSLLGTVIKGTAIGKSLGFPTANIDPHHEVLPPAGIYAVRIIYKGRRLKGVCYIGTKPTFKAEGRRQKAEVKKNIEVYILNFEKNIYGEDLEIQFISKIREDKKFPGPQALVKQIKKDIIRAKKIFSRH